MAIVLPNPCAEFAVCLDSLSSRAFDSELDRDKSFRLNYVGILILERPCKGGFFMTKIPGEPQADPDPSSGPNPREAQRRTIKRLAAFLLGVPVATMVLIAALHFPYHVDAPLTDWEAERHRRFYAEAYASPTADDEQERSEYDLVYTRVAAAAAKAARIEEQIAAFVQQYDLRTRPVLEIGSGRGYLQDMADDYTGLDISPSVRRFYHKKFVVGCATALPFADDSFDGAWSIWVFEHIPNPEQALSELRRVMRDQGVIFFFPAWNCVSWAADGYAIRPYSDFGLGGKVIKASIPVRTSLPYQLAALVPNRLLRSLAYWSGGPTRLRYRRLEPNYETYWQPDSDAVNSIDRYDAMLWFRSRGDECLNCDGPDGSVLMPSAPLVVRIRK